jgi:hypothetical protein
VNQATPTITWATPAAITYGTALSATQLNATASVPGTFAYTPGSGTLAAGAQTLSVTFTPTDTTDYSTATKTVSLQVNQATLTVTWATPGAITYGTALSATQLNATASVPGTFVYTPASGTLAAGAQTLSVTFTPTDITDYASATQTVQLQVNKAALTVTASSTTVGYGSAVPTITASYSGFQNGDTAMALTPAPACSTTYTTASAVGSNQTTNCSGGVSSNYSFSYVSGTVTVVTFGITTSPTLATGYVNSVYSPVTLAVTGGTGPYAWAVASGSVPAGLSLDSATGILSGTPTGPTGTTHFTVQVSDSGTNSAELQFTITIAAGVTISTISPLTPGVQGVAYAGETLAATGGSGSYSWTWAAASGSLPSGMVLSKTTGAISGTPGVSGTYNIVVTATDTASNTASKTFSLTVDPPLSITTAALPGGTANTAYTGVQLTATGGSGNYTWSWAAASGSSLPGGMTFSSLGVLAGTPTAQGSYSVVITAKDTTLNVTSSTTFTLAIAYAPLSITTSALPVGAVSTAYTNTQFAATGGSGTYTWSWAAASGSSLPTNLSFSTSGLLSGTPSVAGSYLVNVTVTDATASFTKIAPFTINIDSAGFSITTANPLPNAYVNSVYPNKALAASGFTLTRTWSVSSGALPTGMSMTSGGAISGTPTIVGTYSFTATVTDTGGNQASATFSLTVIPAVTISTSALTQGTVGVPYSQTLTATGGSGNYTWNVLGSSLPGGLTLSSSSGVLSGTPTTAGSYSLSVTITDSGKTTLPALIPLTIVNPPVSISGQISLVNNCAGATSVPPIMVTLSDTTNTSITPITTTTDSNGNYSFSNVPADSYMITPVVSTPPSRTAPSSVFYPATKSVTVSSSNLTAENFAVALGYSVSGTVTYGGAQSGQVYLQLNAPNCGSKGVLGTSIVYPFTSGGSYTINGVPPGSYTLQAWMDNSSSFTPSGLPNGIPNVVNPTGSASGVSLTDDLVVNAAVTLSDPTVTAVSNTTPGPTLNVVSPTDQGVAISFSPVTNSSGVEAVTSYQVQWSTDSTFASGANNYTFAANGSRGVWLLNNGLTGFSGTLANGGIYYFRSRGTLAGNNTAWSGTSEPITVGPPPSNPGSTRNVNGSVDLPSNITGPLYVGYYNQGTGAIYANRIASPSSSPQSLLYNVNLPDGNNYVFFAIVDQNNNGLIDTGDITNLTGAYSAPVVISGDTSYTPYTLAVNNSTAAVTTQMTQSTDISGTSTTTSYGVSLQLLAGVKLPVATELSGPSYTYLVAPVDFSACTSCGSVQFDYQPGIASAVPTISDNFPLQVTYSDGTTDTAVYAQVTGVGATDSSSNTVAASGLQLSGTSTTPNFGWDDPSNPGNYRYSFSLSDSTGTVLWQIPASNAPMSTFDSSITQISWGSDPTGNTGNTPKNPSLTSGAAYTWSITVVDGNGNSSKTQVSFKP